MANKIWTYDETLVAFDLYTQIPFKKINSRHPKIVDVAAKLGRTSAALSMKMDNIARLDKHVTGQGFKSLSNGAKLEEQVWDDFYTQGDMFIEKVNFALKKYGVIDGVFNTSEECTNIEELPVVKGATKEVVTRIRIGQEFFRKAVLSSYDFKCCVTGISIPQFLIASHIKPWRVSCAEEKTDPHNGLCLNLFHDKAFDFGFITIDKNYKIVVSNQLKHHDLLDAVTEDFIISTEGKQISMPGKFSPSSKMLEYHRDVIFKV